jgi:hypothetical protein
VDSERASNEAAVGLFDDKIADVTVLLHAAESVETDLRSGVQPCHVQDRWADLARDAVCWLWLEALYDPDDEPQCIDLTEGAHAGPVPRHATRPARMRDSGLTAGVGGNAEYRTWLHAFGTWLAEFHEAAGPHGAEHGKASPGDHRAST